jgi:hypothetical protein
MLIARQRPDATNVAGLRTWNSLGRFVKRGEKGIFILAPMVGRRSTKDVATDEPSEDATTEAQRTLYGFRAVYVFDRLSRDLRPSLCAPDVCRECHFRKSLDSFCPNNSVMVNGSGLGALPLPRGVFCRWNRCTYCGAFFGRGYFERTSQLPHALVHASQSHSECAGPILARLFQES